MANSKRWLNDDAPPEIQRLLQAACRDAPPRRAVDRAVLVLGSVGALGTATTSALSAAAKVATTSPSWVVAKWGAVAVFGLGVATTTTVAVRHYASPSPVSSSADSSKPVSKAKVGLSAPAAAPAPAASSTPVPVQSSSAVQPLPVELRPALEPPSTRAESETVATLRNANPTTSATRRAPLVNDGASRPSRESTESNAVATRPANPANDTQLLDEMRILDRARMALLNGQASNATRWLHEYRQNCPAQRLLPEALLLGMQVSARVGDLAKAAEIAREISQRFPNSPHAAKAKEFLDGSGQRAPLKTRP